MTYSNGKNAVANNVTLFPEVFCRIYQIINTSTTGPVCIPDPNLRGGLLNIKMPTYQYGDCHNKYKTVWLPSYPYNVNPNTWKDRLCIETGPCTWACTNRMSPGSNGDHKVTYALAMKDFELVYTPKVTCTSRIKQYDLFRIIINHTLIVNVIRANIYTIACMHEVWHLQNT